jgi:hypothetical protein
MIRIEQCRGGVSEFAGALFDAGQLRAAQAAQQFVIVDANHRNFIGHPQFVCATRLEYLPASVVIRRH